MRGLTRLLQVVLVLSVAFVGIGFLLPSATQIERNVVINARQDQVFNLVSDYKQFQRWSPWAKQDPNAVRTIEDKTFGLDAKMTWSSALRSVGSGTATYVEYIPNSRAAIRLDFDDMGSAIAAFTLKPNADKVDVLWQFDTKHKNIIDRYVGLLLHSIIGKQYEVGLVDLKALAESLPKITTREISYDDNGVTLTGYLAYPSEPRPAPGVIVVHEWWGHNDYARKRANMLAELGYAAFALDMYGDNKLANHPKEAMAFMNEIVESAGLAQQRFNAGLQVLRAQEQVNPDKIAAIGYCFGGAVVLSMARSGADLDGVVSFHGGLSGLAPIAQGGVSAKALVLNGKADPFITTEDKAKFKQEMDAAGADYSFIDYPGAQHAFTSPAATQAGESFGLPLKYDAQADADSWVRMHTFLNDIFSDNAPPQ